MITGGGGRFNQTCSRHLVTRFGAGSVVDRLNAGRTLPLGLPPTAAGLVLPALADGTRVAVVHENGVIAG